MLLALYTGFSSSQLFKYESNSCLLHYKLFGTWCLHFKKKIRSFTLRRKEPFRCPRAASKAPVWSYIWGMVHQDLAPGTACYLPYMQVSIQASCSNMDQIAACYTIGFKLFGACCMHFSKKKKFDPSPFGEKSHSDFHRWYSAFVFCLQGQDRY